MTALRIATRKSPLALWQSEHVAARLRAAHPGLVVELVPMSTRGDEVLDRSLAAIGGKGLFLKELELAMQRGQADCAVHSLKDVPMELEAGFALPAILERADHADIAGAIGWLALERPYLDRWTSCGCFEYHASGPGLANVARDLLARTTSYRGELRELQGDDLSTARLFEAYDKGDEIAVRVMNEATEFWGMATANLVSLFNPETIIFGGGVFGPAVRLLDRIHDEARRWAQPISMTQVSLVPSALGGDAGLLGAARLAMDAEACE